MSKPFDATLRDMLEMNAGDGLAFIGLHAAGPLVVIDTDVSTVTTQADKVIRVGGAPAWLVHIEFQTGRDRHLGHRLLQYNVLLSSRHRVPVQSVVVLLRPEADGSRMTGRMERSVPGGARYLEFRYKVVRAWEKPVAEVMKGGIGMLPLAPLSAARRDELPAIIQRMRQRFDREATPAEAARLWTATYVLMGLRYPAVLTAKLLEGVRAMKESTTYQAILAEGKVEGRAEGLRKALLVVGQRQFGEPDKATRATVEAVTDAAHLEQLL
ncbi:MAG: hypothetical protein K2R98_30185, partial [Gemmataceae bacterium]|nr:hypothetical protein [Gemmataceae bacterium]